MVASYVGDPMSKPIAQTTQTKERERGQLEGNRVERQEGARARGQSGGAGTAGVHTMDGSARLVVEK